MPRGGLRRLREKVSKSIFGLKRSLCSDGYCRFQRSFGVVIFSKDRPLQLELLLESMLKNFKFGGEYKVAVVYKYSSDTSRVCYEQLSLFFPDVGFIVQGKDTLRRSLRSAYKLINSEYVCVMVDDCVVLRETDLGVVLECMKVGGEQTTFSLRLGENIKRSYMNEREMSKPDDLLWNDVCDVGFWRWEQGKDDWGYKYSLDGNVFSSRLFFSAADALGNVSPNKLEAGLMTYYDTNKGLGYCFKESRLLNVPHNRVAEDYVDNKCMSKSSDEMLERYVSGDKIEIPKLDVRKWDSCHMEIDYVFI